MNKIFLSILILLLPVTLMAAAMLPGDAANGKKLHDNSGCLSCHAQIDDSDPNELYTSPDRRISDVGSLMNQVSSCNSYQETGLDESGVDDVVNYLNESFYKFDD